MILRAVTGKQSPQLVKLAIPGRKIELGGKAALQPPPPSLPWKQWLLWAILGAGVGLLAFMVKSLLREISRQG
jgi:hypothetical protein